MTGPNAEFFLFGPERDVATAVTGEVARRGGLGAFSAALRGLSDAGIAAATEEIGTVAAELARLNLSGVLGGAWCRYRALTDAARATLAEPASSRVVDLATHEVTSEHHPYIDVLINEVAVTRVNLELRLALIVAGLVAIVRGGRLVSLRAGRCDLTTTFAVEKAAVLSRRWQLDLPAIVPLGTGIPLIRS